MDLDEFRKELLMGGKKTWRADRERRIPQTTTKKRKTTVRLAL